jgi:hypothetical protein
MRVTSLAASPHISEVDPNSPEFRAALDAAGQVAKGTLFSVYSRHHHYTVPDGMVLFEEQLGLDRLALYPVSLQEAMEMGRPSCWGVAPDGTTVVLRYADNALHTGAGIDVTSNAFLAQLAAAGRAFARRNLHPVLELNVASQLFPTGEGQVTQEVTDEGLRMQWVTLAPTPAEIRTGDWTTAACWHFTPAGDPVVQGVCVTDDGMVTHRPPPPPPAPPRSAV